MYDLSVHIYRLILFLFLHSFGDEQPLAVHLVFGNVFRREDAPVLQAPATEGDRYPPDAPVPDYDELPSH